MSQQPSQRSAPTPSASQTTTIASTSQSAPDSAPRILRLRGRHSANGRSVQWAEDVVDNEGLGRKSSKVCCIYHKPKAVDESSDESSSDSSSDSESDYEERMRRGRGRNGKGPEKDGDHHEGCDHAHDHDDGKSREKKEKRPPSPNAYEKVPKPKRKEEVAEKK
ncbi:Protein phosphatase inhibitor [Cordyceps fumosorosea ARSEF 2679]|uniref:Type 1 phosphatases regulator n=1 Tax=Cordyceps fumosorosea (strain ARSEF 2679) TaxID=1081104 RepID=A0A162MU64_CORFA|nr:Protein phosphatase inhibitor [Cordyceps fumosorosea ARSEF 2679]OAA70469.1 Protein phosphatase inhibitor [Cordyceps fumosorosea ARSEF 2679]